MRTATCSSAHPEAINVTAWLAWFIDTLHRSVDQTQHTLDIVLARPRSWQRWAETPLNERQLKLINRLLDGFEGKLSSSKWAAIANCSPDTALRDILDVRAGEYVASTQHLQVRNRYRRDEYCSSAPGCSCMRIRLPPSTA